MPTVTLARDFDDSHSDTGLTLAFHRAAREGIGYPDDVVALLDAEGVKTGRLRARNPIMHDQWWIPVVEAAKAGVPYADALAAVIRTWLKERKGRQVRLQIGRTSITANTVADAERLLKALAKHEKQLDALQVARARKPQPRKTIAKPRNKK
jgi:hypothetical protein